jgi:hypothetical protein
MKLDLILFPDIDYRSEKTDTEVQVFAPKPTGRVTLGLNESDEVVASREGPQLLISTFIKTLLTEIGSVPYAPSEGTVATRLIQEYNPDTIQEDLSLAVLGNTRRSEQ